jgi:hypothetical protein
MGRGRDSRTTRQRGQYPAAPQHPPGGAGGAAHGPGGPRQQPYGAGSGGPGPRSPYASQGQGGPGAGPGPRPQWPGSAPAGSFGEPEYLGDSADPRQRPNPYAQQPGPAQHGAPDPYANAPGHTRTFSVPDDAYGDPGGAPYGPDDGYSSGGTYSAGRPAAPFSGPRLSWRELLRGVVLRPSATFWQMRDYPVWGPALTITFVYGLLAVFGLDTARTDVINATLGSAIPYVLSTGIAIVLASLILGSVTHTLARQFGGDGSWAPTVGLSMLIMSLTDAPRLVFAVFLGGTNSFVQVLGWLTWIAAGALFATMVSRSHDLPWPKALGASALQLIALLFLIKLGTL